MCKSTNTKPFSHANFQLQLHDRLIKLTSDAFEANTPQASQSTQRIRGTVTPHHLDYMDDKQPCGKARYRVFKVCSVLHRDNPKLIHKTRSFCVECSTENSRIFLCDRIRSVESANQFTCFQIWHQLWKNGTHSHGDKKIRRRSVLPLGRRISTDSNISIDYAF